MHRGLDHGPHRRVSSRPAAKGSAYSGDEVVLACSSAFNEPNPESVYAVYGSFQQVRGSKLKPK